MIPKQSPERITVHSSLSRLATGAETQRHNSDETSFPVSQFSTTIQGSCDDDDVGLGCRVGARLWWHSSSEDVMASRTANPGDFLGTYSFLIQR